MQNLSKVTKSNYREIDSKLTTPENVLGSQANIEQILSVHLQNNKSREKISMIEQKLERKIV